MKKASLNEREISHVLVNYFTQLGWQITTEFVVNKTLLDMTALTHTLLSKVRIDIAAIKNDEIMFIEVENGLWVTHPLIYRGMANYMVLAYPEERKSATDLEQINYAEKRGLGILSVSSLGSIKVVLQPKFQDIPISLKKTIISLLKKNISRKKDHF